MSQPDAKVITQRKKWFTSFDVKMKAVLTYEDLEILCRNEFTNMPPMDTGCIMNVRAQYDVLDRNALLWVPYDSPISAPFTINTTGDGSCFLHAASRLAYGNENHVVEMRVRLIMEAVLHREWYCSHYNLAIGLPSFQPTNIASTLVELYGFTSGIFNEVPEDVRSSPEAVYVVDVMNYRLRNMEAGGWQFHFLASVLERPVLSLYPNMRADGAREGYAQIRDSLNRIIYPRQLQDRSKNYGAIMWCGSSHEVKTPNHFVAIVK